MKIIKANKSTESSKGIQQRELAAEIRQVNKFLSDIGRHKLQMSYFVEGLHVAVKSILAAVDAVKNKHLQESQMTSLQEEENNTEPCPRVKEEGKAETEELQTKNTQAKEKHEESNLSSDLKKSLNDTLDDMDQAEEKLNEMDSQDNMATAEGQPLGDSAYLMHEFLSIFRQRVKQSFEEFLSMESEEMELHKERESLKTLSLDIANSHRKVAKPSSSKRTVTQETKVKNSTPCDTKTTPQKDTPKTGVPSDVETTQKRATKEKSSSQQGNDKDASSDINITPSKEASAASAVEVTPENQKYSADDVLVDDDDDDLPSPVGMQRMFGTMSQESKIQFPQVSPIRIIRDVPTSNLEVSPVGGENES